MVLFFYIYRLLKKEKKTLQILAYKDVLTGADNRNCFVTVLAALLEKSAAYAHTQEAVLPFTMMPPLVHTNSPISWEKTDRAASVSIVTPDGTIYSGETTPEHVILNEYDKCTFYLPDLPEGEYTVEVKGDKLGRGWVDCNKTMVSVTDEPAKEAETKKILKSICYKYIKPINCDLFASLLALYSFTDYLDSSSAYEKSVGFSYGLPFIIAMVNSKILILWKMV